MHLVVNGQKQLIEKAQNIDELLAELGYERNAVAVAQDGSFVPKKDYPVIILKEGMELEVLVPMQGG